MKCFVELSLSRGHTPTVVIRLDDVSFFDLAATVALRLKLALTVKSPQLLKTISSVKAAIKNTNVGVHRGLLSAVIQPFPASFLRGLMTSFTLSHQGHMAHCFAVGRLTLL